jgi:hypothetical protein
MPVLGLPEGLFRDRLTLWFALIPVNPDLGLFSGN